MNKEHMVTETNNNRKMAVQIDEIYNSFNLINNLIIDLSPALEKISKDLSVTIQELRERFERDETLALTKKIGDNIPTFIQLLDLVEVAKGLVNDLSPAIGKITQEMLPTTNMLRESFEKDEVLDLLQNAGENINTFNKLLIFLNDFKKSGALDFTLQQLSSKEMNSMMIGLQKCAVKTMQEITEKPPKPGLRRVFGALRDPEVQKGMMIMTAFAKNMSLSLSEAVQDLSRNP